MFNNKFNNPMQERLLNNFVLFFRKHFDDFSRGECFYFGIHTEKNLDLAKKYYTLAAKNGEVRAFERLVQLETDLNNYAQAHYLQGIIYELGQDWQKALESYQLAGKWGNDLAYLRIARIYKEDHQAGLPGGVSKNPELELKAYINAARLWNKEAFDELSERAKTNGKAAFMLGELCQQGRLTRMDKAMPYYFQAALLNYREALALVNQHIALVDDDKRFQLTEEIYWKKQHNIEEVISRHGELALRNYQPALQSLDDYAKKTPVYAYQIARFFVGKNEIKRAIPYYIKACHGGHLDSLHEMVNHFSHLQSNEKSALAAIYIKHKQPVGAALLYKRIADDGNANVLSPMFALAEESCLTAQALIEVCAEENNQDFLYRLYVISALKQHKGYEEYLNRLEKQAADKDVLAQYYLGCEYYHAKNQLESAVSWAIQSAQGHFPLAMEYLEKTVFTKEIDSLIASIYEQGEGVPVQLEVAIRRYSMAAEKGCQLAQNRLETLAAEGLGEAQYQLSINLFRQQKRVGESLIWLLRAVQSGHPAARQFLDTASFTAEQYCRMAGYFMEGNVVKENTDEAIKLYQKAMAMKHAQSAWELAQYYFSLGTEIESYHQACFLLTQAALWGSREAEARLFELAEQGDPAAQYYLGCELLATRNQWNEAVTWGIKAAFQGHEKAKQYFRTTQFTPEIYFYLAKIHAEGEVIPIHINAVLYYGEKALTAKNPDAAYFLGCFILSNPDLDDSIDKSFSCFLQAATWGHEDAFSAAESLFQQASPNLQFELGKLYLYTSPPNTQRAMELFEHANEMGCAEAGGYLSQLGRKLFGFN